MERIGHYRIIEEMGRGGMGVVYKGYEESLSRFVAIKVLGEHLTRDPLFVKRFQREAQAAARISHPHIVPIYYVGEDAGRHFFAMEYVTGGSLESELRRSGRVEPVRAARWMLETARGLAAAHAEGLIHRDIKPANLLLDREGHVKIADFGLAKATTQATRLTGTGLFLGSPGYLSPEQCRGEELDGRSDVYSLGVTFYELLSGQIPFGGDSPAALVLNIIQSEPPAIEDLNPNVDAELRRILGRMMAKDRDSRYASARDLVRDLDAYLMTAGRASVVDTVAAGAPTRLHGDTELAPTVVEAAPAATVAETRPVAAGAPRRETPSSAVPPQVAASAQVPRRSSRLGLLVASILVGGILVAGAAGWGLWSWLRQGLESQEAETSPGDMISALDDDEVGRSPMEGSPGEKPDVSGVGSEDASEYDPDSTDAADGTSSAPTVLEPGDGAPQATVSEPVTTRPSVPQSVTPSATAPAAASGTVVVVALGEPLMAGHVEGYVEERLQAYGHSLVDERGTAEGLTLFQGGQDPPLESILGLLRPRAQRLVLIQVEYLDGRSLTYLGRSDTAYRSRVSIRALDLASGGPVGTAVEEEVEYTALNAPQAAREAFGTAVRRFVAGL